MYLAERAKILQFLLPRQPKIRNPFCQIIPDFSSILLKPYTVWLLLFWCRNVFLHHFWAETGLHFFYLSMKDNFIDCRSQNSKLLKSINQNLKKKKWNIYAVQFFERTFFEENQWKNYTFFFLLTSNICFIWLFMIINFQTKKSKKVEIIDVLLETETKSSDSDFLYSTLFFDNMQM